MKAPVSDMASDLAWSGVALSDRDAIASFLLGQGWPAKDIGPNLDRIVALAGQERRAEISSSRLRRQA